jgi:hypothetical protein
VNGSGADRIRAMVKDILPEYEPVNGLFRPTETEEPVGQFRKAAGQD